MIFVTVGSQKFPFNRLLKKVDQMAESHIIGEEVHMQTGAGSYVPRCCQYRPFYTRKAFAEMIDKCDILITHGGAGIMIDAVKRGKKTIVVPRLARYGEHVDDHQLQLLEKFRQKNLVYACEEVEELEEALESVRHHSFDRYHSNTGTLLASLDRYLRSLGR